MITDFATSAAGTRYNVKNSATISRTTTTDSLSAGTATSPKIIRGYSTTPGDGYLGRSNVNGALITTNFPVITYTTGRLTCIVAAFVILECLNITGANTASATLTLTNNDFVLRCKIENSANNVNGIGIDMGNGSGRVFDNDVSQTGTSGGCAISGPGITGGAIIANRLTSTTGPGIRWNSANQGGLVILNTIHTCGTDAISGTSTNLNAAIGLNTFVGCTGDGIDLAAQGSLIFIFDNMITDNGGWAGTFGGAASAVITAYNRTRDNPSGTYNNATDWIAATSFSEVTTDTGGPSTDYVDSTTQDYRLIAGSPGTSAGLPSAISMGSNQRSQLSSVSFGPLSGTILTPIK